MKTINFECKVENKSAIVRELTIKVKADTIQNYIEKQYSKLQKKAKIPGFRPGKVPLPIVKKHFMSDAKNEAFSAVVQDTYVQAIDENKIQVIGNPQITPKSGITMNDGEELVFTAQVEILPEIKLPDFSKLKITKPAEEFSQEAVDKQIDDLRRAHAEVSTDEAKTGPVKHDDLVELTFSGTMDGKTEDSLNGKNRMLKVGAGQYLDGFEKNVIGMKKGETKKFNMTFPKDYAHKEYAGKDVEFEVTIHEFKKEVLPELNDEFAKNFNSDSIADLKKKITDDMKKSAERRSRNAVKENTVEAVIEATPFEVPSHFINMQFDYLLRENAKTLLQQGFNEKMIREYLDKNREELKTRAEKQVRATLIIDKLSEKADIKIEDADLEREYAKIADDEKIDVSEVKKFFADENQKRELRFRLKEERTFDYILENAKVTVEKAKS